MKNKINRIIELTERYLLENKKRGKNYIHYSNKKRGKLFLLKELERKIDGCKRCPLSLTRKNIVFGEGNSSCKLMFIGEAPGFDEDLIGKPFVGKAGILLTKIIESISLQRKDVYITNVVKCHPLKDPLLINKRGNDRKPTDDEINTCYPYLKEQINIIHPKIICTLGNIATQTLVNTKENISILRGKTYIFEKKDIVIIPTYHPAFLLRNPQMKKETWEDMKKIRSLLEG